MTPLEREAREAGQRAGYAHAEYVEAYSGDLAAVPVVPLFYRSPYARAEFLAGWSAGLAEHAAECGPDPVTS